MYPQVADSAPQHMVALNEANRVRLSRARLKREVASGELSFEDALDHPDLATMPLLELLMAQRRWGRARSLRLLRGPVGFRGRGLPENKPIGELTARQKRSLLAAMLPRAEREAMLDATFGPLPST